MTIVGPKFGPCRCQVGPFVLYPVFHPAYKGQAGGGTHIKIWTSISPAISLTRVIAGPGSLARGEARMKHRSVLGVGGGGLQEVGHILIVDLGTGYTSVFILWKFLKFYQ